MLILILRYMVFSWSLVISKSFLKNFMYLDFEITSFPHCSESNFKKVNTRIFGILLSLFLFVTMFGV